MPGTSTGKTALITGARGQDGTLLAQHLAGLGYRVVGIERPGSGPQGAALDGVRMVKADVCDPSVFPALLSEVAPDEIYHLAAFHHSTEDAAHHGGLRSRQAMVHTNFGAAAALAFAVLEAGLACHLVLAASSQMYTAAQHSHVIDELTARKPSTFYGHTKAWAADLFAQLRSEAGLRASTAILFNHESPLKRAQFVSRKISQAAAAAHLGRHVSLELLNIGARVDWSSARDVVQALHLMACSADSRDYVVASGQLHSVRDLLDIAFGHVGLDWRKFATFRVDREEPALCGNPSRLETALGWKRTRSFTDIVVEMVEADIARARSAS
jgi:GDPmannose 4,6-dehydratase